jgi:tRNA (adenine37-N6)-methyltransferase
MKQDIYSFPVIGFISSCFKEKFGIPRQPGLVPAAKAQLELVKPYNDPLVIEGLENVSHLWIQFVFHANDFESWKPKVRPPRLGGNQSLGVFATRSPNRPAAIGLSVVKLDRIESTSNSLILHLSGIDLLDGTPVLDIKPYLPYVDRVDQARYPYAIEAPDAIKVTIPEPLRQFCLEYTANTGQPILELIEQILCQNPKPAYQEPDASRVYGMKIYDLDVRWRYPNPDEILVDSIFRADT